MRRISILVSLFLSVPVIAAVGIFPVPQPLPGVTLQRLIDRKPIEQEISKDDSHYYELALTAGQYLHLIVKQRSIAVRVELLGPDGQQLLAAEGPNGRREENLALVTEAAGTYRVRIQSMEKTGTAGQYELQIKELRSAAPEDRGLTQALALFNESVRLSNDTNYEEATAPAERALTMREGMPDGRNIDIGTMINYLAWLYDRRGKHGEAETLFLRALQTREQELGVEHPDVAESLYDLGTMYLQKGDYRAAEPFFQRALAIREKALGPQDIQVSESLNSLAFMYGQNGDYVRAEPLFLRTLSIREKLLGSDHPNVAITLDDLGYLYNVKGDYGRAESLLLRALAIQDKTLSSTDPDLGHTLNDLALLYLNKKEYEKAEPYFTRSAALAEKVLGPEHPDFGRTLDNFARAYILKGDYAKAEPLQQRALDIIEKALGSESLDVATSLKNLAASNVRQRNYAKAEPLFHRALAIEEKVLSNHHPEILRSLGNLATLYRATGAITRALEFQSRANDLSELNLNRNLAAGSERQKLAYLGLFSRDFNFTFSLHNQTAPDDPQALHLAVATLLRRKGRGLDAMVDSIGSLRLRAAPQDQALFDQLSDARAQLAALVSRKPTGPDLTAYRSHFAQLEEQVDQLESRISAQSGQDLFQVQPVRVEAIQSAIPSATVLVEIGRYVPSDAKTETSGTARYVAYVLARQGKPRWVDLGDATAIDQNVDAMRRALSDPNRTDVKRRARTLEESVMRPIRKLIGDTRNILLSPDGSLNLIPFGALVDENDRYLIEKFSFTYLASGRDLLRFAKHIPSRQGPVVMADAQFDLRDAGTGQRGALNMEPRRSPDFTRQNFEPLPGTAAEGKSLGATLSGAKLLMGAQATEAAIKQVKGPSILHVASHGFFLTDLGEGSGLAENPLLRSGLVLAGANQRQSGAGEDGVLTALEMAGLDLWGTKLVVLSACDTGLGEVKNGEGVFGLRRAMVLAGSESQVMSLWQVSDRATQQLMVDYYAALKNGQGRSAGLRAVQLKMLRVPTLSHPYYWAAFIASGEWANLEGRR